VCKHTVEEQNGQLVIGDLTSDPRFKNNSFVIDKFNLRSYLGISTGERIGTVCVFDNVKREFTKRQIKYITTLANYTSKLIDEKIKVKIIEEQRNTLQILNENLETFTYMVAHDVKAPIRTINAFSNLILKKKEESLDVDTQEYLGFIQQSSISLAKLVDDLLEYSRQIQIESTEFEFFDANELIEDVIGMLDPPSTVILQQVSQNIVSNAIKYKDNNKETNQLNIAINLNDDFCTIIFEDNGIGISKERLETIFNLFAKDKRNEFSTGVGCSVIRTLLDKIGGKVEIESQVDIGTIVKIMIPNKVTCNSQPLPHITEIA